MPTRKAPEGYAPDLPPGYTLRRVRPGDEQDIAALLIRAFDGLWPRRTISVTAVEHVRWKLNSDPLAFDEQLVLEQGGRIIAVRPVWISHVKVGDRVVLARSSVDRAVLPEFQRKGITTAMDAHVPAVRFGQFDAVLGISNAWQSVRFVPGEPYRRKLDVFSSSLDGTLPEVAVEGWTIQVTSAFDERADRLWEAASSDFDFALVRTAERLNYRYADKRAGEYTILIAEEDGRQLFGYVVYASWNGVGQIADAFVLPGRDDVLRSLVAFALRQLQALGNASAECWRDLHHPYGTVLEELGLASRLRSHTIALHIPGSEDDAAFFADLRSPVHFMAGDTDLV